MKVNWGSVRGITFIELLISLSIFAIGILALTSLQGITLMSTDMSGHMSMARMMASDQLDRLSGLAYTNTALDPCITAYCHKDVGRGVDGGTMANLDYTGMATPKGRFRREWDVQDVVTGVKKVSVRVYWSDVPGLKGGTTPAQTFNRKLEMSSTKIDPT